MRARAGGETGGIEIRMVTGRLFRISGLVTDSQGRPRAGQRPTREATARRRRHDEFGFSTDEQGRFQMRNIPPGNYRLTVRQQIQRPVNGLNAARPTNPASSPSSR